MKARELKLECQHCESRYRSVFCDLEPELVSQLNNQKSCSSYKKGQTIFLENVFANGLFCVNAGKIKVHHRGDLGRDQIMRLAKPGDILGYRALLTGERYAASATAIEDASVCFVPKDVFLQLISLDTNLSLQIMKLLSSDLKHAEHRMTEMAQKPVRERLAESLLFIKETYGFESDGITLQVKLTREEIANIVGTATETTIRLLSELKQDGIVELDGRSIRILSLPRLVRIANVHD